MVQHSIMYAKGCSVLRLTACCILQGLAVCVLDMHNSTRHASLNEQHKLCIGCWLFRSKVIFGSGTAMSCGCCHQGKEGVPEDSASIENRAEAEFVLCLYRHLMQVWRGNVQDASATVLLLGWP